MLRRIKATNPNFLYFNREINLQELKKQFEDTIRGGWFSNLEIADVQTAAIFGSNVGDSEEWLKYSKNGVISALVLQMSYRGLLKSILISKNGAIVLYQKSTEVDSLEFIEAINDIVNRFSTELPGIRNRQDSKKKE
jgi:hypothetical protein